LAATFRSQQFNRATQAARQVGFAFKFVYTAAIDRGYTPVSTILDAPVAFPTGPYQQPYSPQNYDREFWGPVTLRRALEQSRNVPAVKMMDALGPQQVISYARRLGLTSPIPPYLAVALGAAEATLLEMTSAYSVFPNQGVRMAPFEIVKVSDREGNVLEEHRPEPHDAIRADTAYVMTSLLRRCAAGTAAGGRFGGRSRAKQAPPTTTQTRGSSLRPGNHRGDLNRPRPKNRSDRVLRTTPRCHLD
jgi:penicillin-binding protein 1A